MLVFSESSPVFLCFMTVRQDPLLGASEMFNSFLRKAQQVGSVMFFFFFFLIIAGT